MLTRMKSLVVLAGLALAFSSGTAIAADSSSSSAPGTAKVKAAIEAANAKFLEVFKRGDKAGLMANYASDAVVMMPNEEAWRGQDGMDKGFSGFLGQFTFKEGAATTTDVMVAGDLAVETGTYSWTLQPKAGGGEIKDRGKYLTVWKRQPDGTWKIVRDINNTDLPPAK
jgi:ketosteroid isomerase-like protein